MEKEKPILLSDLIPPEEMDSYVPEPEDVIPIRTWSRGDPFDLDGGFEMAFQGRHHSVGNSQNSDGTNGMLNYTAIQQVFDGQEIVEEEEGEGEYGDEEEEDDGEYPGDYENEDGEMMPDYKAFSQGSALLAEDDGSLEADYDAYLDEEGDTADEGADGEEDGEGEEYEQDEQYPGEEDDEVNYDDGEEADYNDYEDAPGGFDIANEHFEKVVLSPREMELIASSEPTGEVNDLVDIMNEYNELVNYLASPRGNPKKGPGGSVKKQAQQATKKTQMAPKPRKAVAPAAATPVNRRLLPHSDDSEGNDASDYDSDNEAPVGSQSASNPALLTRDKLNILTGMVQTGGGKPSAQAAKQDSHHAKPALRKQGSTKDAKKKPKKKLFGQALEDHKAMQMQMKLVGRSEVDDKLKVRMNHIQPPCFYNFSFAIFRTSLYSFVPSLFVACVAKFYASLSLIVF